MDMPDVAIAEFVSRDVVKTKFKYHKFQSCTIIAKEVSDSLTLSHESVSQGF
jgi:hypothetical protein